MPNADRRPLTLALVIALALPFVAMAGPAAATTGPVTMRVSVASDGTEGNSYVGIAVPVSVSADGRFVAFQSNASNLVSGDTNGVADVFVHDMLNGTTVRVSVASDGTQGDAGSYGAEISAGGGYVVFSSNATNLVPGDVNAHADVFVHDLQTGATTLESVASDGHQGDGNSLQGSISSDGHEIAFASEADNLVPGDVNGLRNIFVHDTQTGATVRVDTLADGPLDQNTDFGSYSPAISENGRYVIFASASQYLMPGPSNGYANEFEYDLQAGTTTPVNVASDGTLANYNVDYNLPASLSGDGRHVAFDSSATNLVSGELNNRPHVFFHDVLTGTTTMVSVDSNGVQADNDCPLDADCGSTYPSISADGTTVAFVSSASNLVAGDTNGRNDVFVHIMLTGATTRVSVSSQGSQADLDSFAPFVSSDGSWVVFSSDATDLVPGDAGGNSDVFVSQAGSLPTYAVTASVTGGGVGTVTSSSPPGFSCTATCVASVSPGTVVTFTAGAGPFASFQGWSGACSGVGPCQVTVASNRSVGARFTATAFPPKITKVTPGSALVGKKVTIKGTHLTGATTVSFDGAAASILSNTDTTILATVPTNALTGFVKVTTPVGTGTSPSVFTVNWLVPTITKLAPVRGHVGKLVTILGTGFLGTTQIRFNGVAVSSFTVVSAKKITATVPAGATHGNGVGDNAGWHRRQSRCVLGDLA